MHVYEKDMIESIFKFNDTRSKDIMTSRKDTFSINIDDDVEEFSNPISFACISISLTWTIPIILSILSLYTGILE